MTALNLKAWRAVAGVFAGCCSNVIFLELLVKNDPGCGILITFCQFVFIAIEGYIFTSRWGTVKPVIGWADYAVIVLMFFITSICNNYAFDFNIPMPLHMIFRSGSLMANMIMGIILLKRRYSISKYVAVILITIGVIICTLISVTTVQDNKANNDLNDTVNDIKVKEISNADDDGFSALFWWSVGILILTVGLLVSACMGIYQEAIYKKYGKHSREALYYTHLMPLPGFLFMSSNIWKHILISIHSPLLVVAGFQTPIPEQIVYLICNIFTQYVCISSVYVLTAECTSLTVTLVVTLRKFFSLLVSVVYFKNEFTIYHWIGTLLVFTGTAIFTEVLPTKVTFKSSKCSSKNGNMNSKDTKISTSNYVKVKDT